MILLALTTKSFRNCSLHDKEKTLRSANFFTTRIITVVLRSSNKSYVLVISRASFANKNAQKFRVSTVLLLLSAIMFNLWLGTLHQKILPWKQFSSIHPPEWYSSDISCRIHFNWSWIFCFLFGRCRLLFLRVATIPRVAFGDALKRPSVSF